MHYAISLGVPAEAIVLDYAGRRTYDTCYRAKAIFGLSSALLVTQPFHLPRALFECNALGVQASGVAADNHHYSPLLYWSGISVSSLQQPARSSMYTSVSPSPCSASLNPSFRRHHDPRRSSQPCA